MVCAIACASVARGQTISTEVDVTAGYSTEGLAAGATQIRGFGDVGGGVSFFAEAAWAARSVNEGDAFGGAYPYGNQVQVIEAFGERIFRPGQTYTGIRAGRFRTPFGISGRSDHAYGGFLRPPLIRYDDYFGLSNSFLEHGVDVLVGSSRLSVEASVGRPADVGEAQRRAGPDTSARGQLFLGPLLVGVSYVRSLPYMPERFASGHLEFGGVDARWMRGGVQARGEWIVGQPFDGTSTDGGYVDLFIHRPAMGPFTATVRIERLDYDTVAPRALYVRRATAGGRIRLPRGLTLQLDAVHAWGNKEIQQRATPIDFALTYSVRREVRRGGE